MKKIQVKAPTRVDLAGGTLDLWPLYCFLTKPYTINLAIDIYTRCEIEERNDKKILVSIPNLNFEKEYLNLAQALEANDEAVSILRPHFQYWKPEKGFRIQTQSDSPIGGGLGGSSSLTISIIHAFATWLEKKFSPAAAVKLASNLEAQLLRTPTGTQDYYPPIHGGLLALQYDVDDCHIEKLPFPGQIFEDQFLLVYTGQPHHSGMNNWQVLKDIIDGNKNTFQILQNLEQVSLEMQHELKNKNWQALPQLFSREYENRTALSSAFTSDKIRELNALALKSGAMAVKICGAGGGGCVLVWAEKGKKQTLAQSLQKQGFQVLTSKPVEHGIEIKIL